ncbi:Uu.00g084510.m01.CDS01 [Anthostomella pinea]|uniref:Nucleolar protein 16 n=1 Tax=Anthostomella pinea TaxID=933095 RepID=A0AAI8VLR8_9PEZI|nr:Uu.00g084510.m01.CDS01 [Anthostomella pinea]
MGRDLQKRKRRSSRPTMRQPTSTKSNRLLNPLGNSIVAKNWNKNETTTQNYRRLGLMSRLKAPTGGVEPRLQPTKSQQSNDDTQKAKKLSTKPTDPFAINPAGSIAAVVSEARVERDESGRIVRVIEDPSLIKRRRANPLNDPLVALDSDYSDAEISNSGREDRAAEEWGGIDEEDGEGEGNAIFRQLAAEANRPVEKKPRGQSTREVEWLERLTERHGADTRAMARDRRLNPMQQTEADISKRIRKWKGEAAA